MEMVVKWPNHSFVLFISDMSLPLAGKTTGNTARYHLNLIGIKKAAASPCLKFMTAALPCLKSLAVDCTYVEVRPLLFK